MHHSTPVLTGTEKIIKHYDFEAWFVHIKRVKRGFYEAEFVKMHDEPKSLPDFELTAIYYQMLEQMIRQQPELYLWTHNRFKHAEKIES
jgi:KDO2-lipid IV(A) lauroyltransferase